MGGLSTLPCVERHFGLYTSLDKNVCRNDMTASARTVVNAFQFSFQFPMNFVVLDVERGLANPPGYAKATRICSDPGLSEVSSPLASTAIWGPASASPRGVIENSQAQAASAINGTVAIYMCCTNVAGVNLGFVTSRST
jgi:hypothetical protein